ncbi:MAG: patatin-like phospholipase family protein [Ginsengibacter sp.]
MRQFFHNFYYSFPVQLLILHFRKFQILLLLWLILFSTVTGYFMKNYGANALFLAPEYLGNVNAAGAALTGIAVGIFTMSWNITTFILHSKRYRFLATTSKPFLKYCINNCIIPVTFLIVYFIYAIQFDINKELMSTAEFILAAAGFTGGFILTTAFSFAYFFTADKRILRTFRPLAKDEYKSRKYGNAAKQTLQNNYSIKVRHYISGLKFKKARQVGHYGEEFLDRIFKHHHLAAILSLLLAFIFMVFIGFFLDNKFFQIPAAASITILFAMLIAVMGALTYFLQTWSFIFMVALYFTLDILYRYDVIDPRNKAYGLNYINKNERPEYTNANLLKLCSPQNMESDKAAMLQVLNNWKIKQEKDKPVMVLLNFSGGGVRSACFAMNVLQHLDSLTNRKLLQKTFLISGASGGMLSATYFRELYRNRQNGKVTNLQARKYLDNISGDLLNPVFSSMIARDLLAPGQKFSVNNYKYVKDRGYAFEQKLNENTEGVLDKNLGNYMADENAAHIPLIIFNSVITRDGRRLMICSQPVSFLMQPSYAGSDSISTSPDAVDFAALFAKQDPLNIRLLTALRMNATFPYVLPNVWLPSNPIIDVMDAGLRDNFGQETSLRFLNVFKEWIKENTGGVVLLQIRDTERGGWEKPFESTDISGVITKPGTILQYNWYKLQEYAQNDQIAYASQFLDSSFHRITFEYRPENEEKGVTVNFHLTAREKKEIISSVNRPNNLHSFEEVKKYFR